MRSLRSHLIRGAVLWTAGLFAIASLALTTAMFSHPHLPVAFHEIFRHWVAVGVTAVLCLAAGFREVHRALTAVRQLRTQLSAVHGGRESRVAGHYPAEVEPLVADLNTLLDHRERVVRRAMSRAGDLAHGLKTPLALLAQEADAAEAAGQPALARSIRQQIDRMRRQVDYHLAHARAAASGATPGAHTGIRAPVEALVRTMERLHAERRIHIEITVPQDVSARVEREDLDEMLGNVIDNACKWAGSRVIVGANSDVAFVAITVDDDGPGLAADLRVAVLRRGVRADEAAPGSGLGLAIVRDVADLYGGSIALDQSPLGGLRVRLRLPG